MVLATAALMLVAGPAQAQVVTPGLGTLSDVPGQTPFQLANSNAIDVLCPKLVALAPPSTTPSTAQGDLTTSCSQLKGTASQLQGQQGATNFSLDLSNAQLANVLGQWSHDQATENSRASIEIGARQARTIAGRLAALRLGARGINVTGLGPDGSSKDVTWAQVLDPGGTGGGASADSGPLGRLGVWANATYLWGSKDPTTREIGFDFDIAGVIIGADYRVTDNLIIGAAFDYAHTWADFDSNAGNTRTNSYGGLLYGTYYLDALYVDGYIGGNGNVYDTERRIVYSAGPSPGSDVAAGFTVNRTATATPTGAQINVGAGAGYAFAVRGFTLTPLFGTQFIGLKVNNYTEEGADGLNLKVHQQKATSLVTALGGQVSYAFSLPFGVLVPQLRAEWRHELLNNSRGIRAQYAADPFGVVFAIPTDDPDRDYASLSAGVSGVFKGGWQAFLNYEALVGLNNFTVNQLTAGFRFDF